MKKLFTLLSCVLILSLHTPFSTIVNAQISNTENNFKHFSNQQGLLILAIIDGFQDELLYNFDFDNDTYKFIENADYSERVPENRWRLIIDQLLEVQETVNEYSEKEITFEFYDSSDLENPVYVLDNGQITMIILQIILLLIVVIQKGLENKKMP